MIRLLLTLCLLLLLVAGCGESAREKAAKADLQNAQQHELLLPFEQVVALYQAVIDTYPDLSQAEEAKAAIARVEQLQKEKLFRRGAAEVLERAATVLNGYRAFSGKFPAKLQELDQGYMFDSSYMAEILPDGAELYVSLGKSTGETRMWLQQQGQSQVLSRTLESQTLKSLSDAELGALKSKWQEVAKVGRLAQVKL